MGNISAISWQQYRMHHVLFKIHDYKENEVRVISRDSLVPDLKQLAAKTEQALLKQTCIKYTKNWSLYRCKDVFSYKFFWESVIFTCILKITWSAVAMLPDITLKMIIQCTFLLVWYVSGILLPGIETQESRITLLHFFLYVYAFLVPREDFVPINLNLVDICWLPYRTC